MYKEWNGRVQQNLKILVIILRLLHSHKEYLWLFFRPSATVTKAILALCSVELLKYKTGCSPDASFLGDINLNRQPWGSMAGYRNSWTQAPLESIRFLAESLIFDTTWVKGYASFWQISHNFWITKCISNVYDLIKCRAHCAAEDCILPG